jgi:two-component system, OmpR family, sensor histidine kinase BaeS
VTEALHNLLSNAIKYTPPGGTVSVSAQAFEKTLEITIADTGIGIRSEDLPRLFREFERITPAPGTTNLNAEGTGLGLAISQRLISLHGGSISVVSQPGKGSRFTIRLPIGQPPIGQEAGPSAANLPEAGPAAKDPAKMSADSVPQGLPKGPIPESLDDTVMKRSSS